MLNAQTAGRSTGPLRHRLFLLAASGLLPLALMAAAAAAYLVADRRQEALRSALELSRALGSAADAELRATVGVLRTLGQSAELEADRLDDFRATAQRIAHGEGWRSVVLADGSGRVLLSTALPAGEPVASPVDPASMQRVLASRTPVVGTVLEGRHKLGPAFAVRVPVLREGSVRYVLSAVIPVEKMLGVVQRQKVPEDWVVGIFDSQGQRVARSRETTQRHASPSLLALVQQGGAEGSGETHTLEGEPAYTGFVRVGDSGWVVAVGVERSEARRALAPLLGALLLGLLASLAVSAWLAWVFARRVSQPIDTLKEAAAALGAGDRLAMPPLGVAELDEVGQALAQAALERDRQAERRRVAEQERDALLLKVTDALEAAQAAGRSKDEFLAELAHELRNPLAPITNALRLLQGRAAPGAGTELRVIDRQVQQMTRLVDDLLDVSRITGRRLALQKKPMLASEWVNHALEALRPQLAGRTLQADFTEVAGQARVSGDDLRLAQVLNNLLGNALKFTQPGGRLRVALDATPSEVVVEVSDDGAGMAPEVLERAFDLFYQAPQSGDRPRAGLGLGLAIVRSLVQMHGGSVVAHSDGPGRGCRFMLRLPRVEAPHPEAAALPAAPQEGGGKVLVVDDNRDAADTTAALLEACGFETQVAYDPHAALEAAASFSPDSALLDIGLPGMTGYELAARMRAAGFAGRLVALTGYARGSGAKPGTPDSFDAHLTKPVTLEALLDALRHPAG